MIATSSATIKDILPVGSKIKIVADSNCSAILNRFVNGVFVGADNITAGQQVEFGEYLSTVVFAFAVASGSLDYQLIAYPGTMGAAAAEDTGAEIAINKSLDLDADKASNIKYPSVKSVYDWATGLFNNAWVIARTLTGYSSSAGTITSSDTILSAIQKLNGNIAGFESASNKNSSGGYAGLTLFKINFKNAANTFTNFLTNATTAARTWAFPDWDMTVAGLVSNCLILMGTAGTGLKVGGATPTFGWADLKGTFVVDGSGANAPTTETMDVGIEKLGYNASDKGRWQFHIEHKDIVGGTKYIHAHIQMARGATAATTNLVLTHVIKHNKHHFDGQTARSASASPITITQTITPTQLNTIPAGSEGVFEFEFANTGGTGGKLNSSDFLIDDTIDDIVTVTTLPSITGGASSKISISHVDIHREVNDGSGTKNKDDVAGTFYAV